MTADLRELVPVFAAEFPAFEFTTQRTHHGRSLVAERRAGETGSLYVVVTSDPGEMRRMLRARHRAGSRRARSGGGQVR